MEGNCFPDGAQQQLFYYVFIIHSIVWTTDSVNQVIT